MVNGLHEGSADVRFQGKDDQERFIFYFRQHWMRILPVTISTLLWSVAILGAAVALTFMEGNAGDSTQRGVLIGLFLVFAFVHIRFLARIYTYFLYVIVVTDRKVHRVKKTFFSIDDHQSIDIWTFQDVMKQQHGLLQNLFGYGSLILEAQDSELRLHFVPRITTIHDRLSEIRERARERMVKKPGVPMEE